MSASPLRIVPSNSSPLSRRKGLWIKEGKKCHWCGCPTRLSSDHAWDAATIDHVIPRYKGGAHSESNMVSACNRCNNRRNHEDAKGLAEGSLLGQFKSDQTSPSPNAGGANKPMRVALSITAKVPAYQTHIEQRDQALKEITVLRGKIGMLEKDAIVRGQEIADLRAKMAATTVTSLLRERLARRILGY